MLIDADKRNAILEISTLGGVTLILIRKLVRIVVLAGLFLGGGRAWSQGPTVEGPLGITAWDAIDAIGDSPRNYYASYLDKKKSSSVKFPLEVTIKWRSFDWKADKIFSQYGKGIRFSKFVFDAGPFVLVGGDSLKKCKEVLLPQGKSCKFLFALDHKNLSRPAKNETSPFQLRYQFKKIKSVENLDSRDVPRNDSRQILLLVNSGKEFLSQVYLQGKIFSADSDPSFNCLQAWNTQKLKDLARSLEEKNLDPSGDHRVYDFKRRIYLKTSETETLPIEGLLNDGTKVPFLPSSGDAGSPYLGGFKLKSVRQEFGQYAARNSGLDSLAILRTTMSSKQEENLKAFHLDGRSFALNDSKLGQEIFRSADLDGAPIQLILGRDKVILIAPIREANQTSTLISVFKKEENWAELPLFNLRIPYSQYVPSPVYLEEDDSLRLVYVNPEDKKPFKIVFVSLKDKNFVVKDLDLNFLPRSSGPGFLAQFMILSKEFLLLTSVVESQIKIAKINTNADVIGLSSVETNGAPGELWNAFATKDYIGVPFGHIGLVLVDHSLKLLPQFAEGGLLQDLGAAGYNMIGQGVYDADQEIYWLPRRGRPFGLKIRSCWN